ncbi:hypothetical protein [Methylobacterium gnaphalii]|uniref:Uncharacterized protein n=1 Tax=Methylobacterium gnaphalii TaxID=1010610 RepID=A0A512JPE3_9HYPH|nr:hypothetical protein [Methylobacterium gnaphalii]GEP11825.1 hypothetical protein MGN01_36700 [Methylobacterium gnaphalii]GJD69409.1 hypothetical protein MMMDOFMJ_2340 [Methylobacterium gnaphalii]GLS49540.1 hypothetical protein GCM10007885_23890 [Methylobacterium gnaphalii]
MIKARFANAEGAGVTVELAAGDQLGTVSGPASFYLPVTHPTYADLLALIAAGSAEPVAAFAAPSVVAPDNPTLSDWRVGLTLWKRPDGTPRIDEVTGKVNALIAAPDATGAVLGKVAKERLEFANNVLRAQLLALAGAFGFTPDDVEESLWRADRVRQGDLSGVWPLPTI